MFETLNGSFHEFDKIRGIFAGIPVADKDYSISVFLFLGSPYLPNPKP